jgi:hypothetical protein
MIFSRLGIWNAKSNVEDRMLKKAIFTLAYPGRHPGALLACGLASVRSGSWPTWGGRV